MATNPLIQQGTLNRVRTSLVVPNYPNLNVTAPYLGKSQITVDLAGPFDDLIGTATGAVTSPEPYTMGTMTVNLLKTQSLAAQWLAQAQTTSDLGTITAHSDSASWPEITLNSAIIRQIEPGVYDGTDPVIRVTLEGVFYLNNDLWNL